jgi:hypothetical protein
MIGTWEMTDHQVAVAVVRQFFEALGAKDYAKAGRLMEGLPPEKMKELCGNSDGVRIISVGEPAPHPNAATQFLGVPYEVEFDRGGAKEIKKGTAWVRPVYNQADRWTIGGGI